MKTMQCKCSKCNGAGTLNWTRLANGVCFQCEGAGVLIVSAEELETRRTPRAIAIKRIAGWLADFAACDLGSWHQDSGDRHGRACLVFIASAIAYAPDDVSARALVAVEKALENATDADWTDAAGAIADLHQWVRHYTAELVAGKKTIVRSVRKCG